MFRTLLAALLVTSAAFAAPRGVKFKDTPTLLGPVEAGTLFDIDLRTLLSSPGIPPLTWVANNAMPAWLRLDAANNRLSGTPQASDAGTVSFRMSVSDSSGEAGDVNHEVRVTVTAPPKWKNDPLDLGIQNEGTPWTFALTSVVTNPTPGALTFQISGQPGWMSLNPTTGVLSGTPRRVDVGKYSGIRITAIGKGGASDVAAFGEVLKTIVPPRWTAKEISLAPNPVEDQSYSRSLTEFVVNPEGAALTFEVVSQTPPPWLSVGNTSGTLFGTPGMNNVGPGSISVVLRGTIDGKNYEDTAAFKLTVEHVNHPPKWLANPLVAPDAFTGLAYTQPLANSFRDPDPKDTHTFTLLPGAPAWLKIDTKTGVLSGTPGKGDVGTASAQVKVADQDGASDTTTVQIKVIKSNEPPVWTANPLLLQDGAEDAPYDLDLNQPKYVVDPDGDAITFTKLSGPAWVTVSPQGKLVGRPGKNDVGIAKVQIRAADGISGSSVTEAHILIVATNHAPYWTMNPIRFTVKEDAPLALSLAPYAKDPDNDTPLLFTLVEASAWVTVGTDGSLKGTPGANQVGESRLKVRVSDPKQLSADAEVIITVQHVNHPPSWIQDPIVLPNVKEGDSYSQILSGFAKDPDVQDILSFSLVDGPAWARVGASGVISGTPSRADVGLNSFRVRVMDPYNEFADVTVRITVEKVNKPPRWRQNPILLSDAFTEEAYQFNLAPFAVDDDGDPLTFRLAQGPAWMKVSAAGMVSGTPAIADKGPFNVVFEVTDTLSPPVPANGSGTVFQKNKPPVISPELPTFIVKERSVFRVNLGQYITDPDGDPINYVLLDPAPWVSLSATGDLLVNKPAFKDIGLHTFKLKVDDGKVATHGSLSIKVIRDPRPPIWLEDPVKFVAKTNQPFSESLLSFVRDEDGLPITFTKKSGKTWLTASNGGTLSGTPRDVDLGQNAFVIAACNDVLCADGGVLVDVQWGTKEDSFATDDAIPGSRSDNLWVIDNSQPCDRLITEFKKHIPTYYSLLDAAKIHHAGIYLSSDAHKWDGMPIRESGKPRLFKWTDVDLVRDFLKRVDVGYSPGSCGNCYNSPIWTIERFTSHLPNLTDVYHQGYTEEGVPVEAMILTQQKDHHKWYTKYLPDFSKFTAEDYARRFKGFYGEEGQNVRISAITPKCPSLISQTGDPGSYGAENDYQVVVNRTGGTNYTLNCDFNVAAFLKDHAAKVIRRAYLFGHRNVTLSKVPVESHTIRVWLGGTELKGNTGADSDQWRYDGATNSVRIYWERIDLNGYQPGDRIRVQYRVS